MAKAAFTEGIALVGLSKTYRGNRVPTLHSVTLQVEPGTVLALIGPNGAGKTTLMGCLLGLLRPEAGVVTIGGFGPDDLRAKAQLGYLPERLTFNRWMSGMRFMRDQWALAGQPKQGRDGAIEELLGRVGLARESWGRAIKKYSYGMLRRLGLAQALIGDPRFLLLDEPVSGLDPAGVAAFREIFLQTKKRGGVVVFTSHQLDQVAKVSDRILFINRGRVEETKSRNAGTLEKLFLKAEGK